MEQNVDMQPQELFNHTIIMRTLMRYSNEKKYPLSSIEKLLKENSTINVNNFTDIYGNAVLNRAIYNYDTPLVKLLLNYNVDVNKGDKDKVTPLMSIMYVLKNEIADEFIKKQCFVITELLIAAGADIHKKDNEGRTVIDLAKMYCLNDFAKIVEAKALEASFIVL